MKKSLLFKPASSRLLVKFTVLLFTALLVMLQQNKLQAQCTYSISLLDTYGDGWNGGAVTVNVGGTNVLTGSTLASGYGPATYNFTVYQGQSITVNYTAGSWSSENYYRVYNAANAGGTQIFQSTQYATPPASQAITNGCTSPMPACTGTPTPGNTNATLAAVPVGGTTVLSVQNTFPLASYQWQSSSSSTGPWANIAGATNSTYTLTYSTPTWFRCVLVCGTNTGISNPTQIVTGPCISTSYYGAGSGYYGRINSVNFNTLSHSTTTSLAAPYYASYSPATTTTTVMAGVTYNLALNTGYYNGAGAWFDWNNNSIFETTEFVSFGTNTSWTMWGGTVAVTVPNNAFNGEIAMRIRTEYAGYTLGAGSALSLIHI